MSDPYSELRALLHRARVDLLEEAARTGRFSAARDVVGFVNDVLAAPGRFPVALRNAARRLHRARIDFERFTGSACP